MMDRAKFKLAATGTDRRGLDVETVRKSAHARLDQFFDKLDKLKKWSIIVDERHPL